MTSVWIIRAKNIVEKKMYYIIDLQVILWVISHSKQVKTLHFYEMCVLTCWNMCDSSLMLQYNTNAWWWNLRFIWLRSPLLLMAGCYFFGACWASGPSADFIFTIVFSIRRHIADWWDQNNSINFFVERISRIACFWEKFWRTSSPAERIEKTLICAVTRFLLYAIL